jgi:hypothetical protein
VWPPSSVRLALLPFPHCSGQVLFRRFIEHAPPTKEASDAFTRAIARQHQTAEDAQHAASLSPAAAAPATPRGLFTGASMVSAFRRVSSGRWQRFSDVSANSGMLVLPERCPTLFPPAQWRACANLTQMQQHAQRADRHGDGGVFRWAPDEHAVWKHRTHTDKQLLACFTRPAAAATHASSLATAPTGVRVLFVGDASVHHLYLALRCWWSLTPLAMSRPLDGVVRYRPLTSSMLRRMGMQGERALTFKQMAEWPTEERNAAAEVAAATADGSLSDLLVLHLGLWSSLFLPASDFELRVRWLVQNAHASGVSLVWLQSAHAFPHSAVPESLADPLAAWERHWHTYPPRAHQLDALAADVMREAGFGVLELDAMAQPRSDGFAQQTTPAQQTQQLACPSVVGDMAAAWLSALCDRHTG